MDYKFDSSLFMGMPDAVNSKSLASFLRPLGINRNTWKYWCKIGDLPLVQMLRICKHYEYDPSQFIEGLIKDEYDNYNTKFRIRMFSDALSIFSHKTVIQACRTLGISTATFARQLRNNNESSPSLSVQDYISWCQKAGLNPADYIYDGDVNIKMNY